MIFSVFSGVSAAKCGFMRKAFSPCSWMKCIVFCRSWAILFRMLAKASIGERLMAGLNSPLSDSGPHA